ncbi:MAG TPA: tetratricopeptide repeat protein, partial [Tepidisphaeraceae bacterium]|nr:tetratricopeptide repeat protein [Tepidisphaeraceae bacterium]
GGAGCAGSRAPAGQRYETVSAVSTADRAQAEKLATEGRSRLNAGDHDGAATKFRDAIIQDMNYGPAHNGLGVALFRQGRFYEAAWEFDYAAKLMPKSPQPLINLGMIAEIAGKQDEAMTRYESALALDPNSVEAIGYLVRLRIKQGVRDARTQTLLDELLSRDTRPTWRRWAELESTRIPSAPPTSPE